MRLRLLSIILCAAASAQQTNPTVTLTWEDARNPPETTYSIYRASGLCSGTPVFAKIATGVTVKTYADTTATTGNYCYAVTATYNGVESAQSNSSAAAVPSFPPTQLQIQVRVP